jgi:hypothetical protein
MDTDKEQEYRDEAERLKLLSREEQRQILDFSRDVANGKGVPARERKAGLERVAALERLLNLQTKKRGK